MISALQHKSRLKIRSYLATNQNSISNFFENDSNFCVSMLSHLPGLCCAFSENFHLTENCKNSNWEKSMCFGENVGSNTRCVHCKFQVCRLSTKKSYGRKIVRKEKSLKPGNVCAQTMLFCAASQNRLVARYWLINKKNWLLLSNYGIVWYVILRKISCSFH